LHSEVSAESRTPRAGGAPSQKMPAINRPTTRHPGVPKRTPAKAQPKAKAKPIDHCKPKSACRCQWENLDGKKQYVCTPIRVTR
jgi:hypothetical protein